MLGNHTGWECQDLMEETEICNRKTKKKLLTEKFTNSQDCQPVLVKYPAFYIDLT